MSRICPHDNLLCGEFVHMKVCHVVKFLHMTDFFPRVQSVYGPDYDECGGNQLCCKNQFINAFLFFSVAFMKQVFPEHWLAWRQTSQSYFIPHRVYQNTRKMSFEGILCLGKNVHCPAFELESQKHIGPSVFFLSCLFSNVFWGYL